MLANSLGDIFKLLQAIGIGQPAKRIRTIRPQGNPQEEAHVEAQY
jgi:hypothetical protein